MFSKPPPMTRIAVGKVGKLVGFIFGLLFLMIFYPAVDSLLGWGVLLWYGAMGAVIGVFGVYTRHPVLDLPLPWWVRAPFIGAWFNFVLMFGPGAGLTSPRWFVLEGAIVGLIVGGLATKLSGEGPETVAADMR